MLLTGCTRHSPLIIRYASLDLFVCSRFNLSRCASASPCRKGPSRLGRCRGLDPGNISTPALARSAVPDRLGHAIEHRQSITTAQCQYASFAYGAKQLSGRCQLSATQTFPAGSIAIRSMAACRLRHNHQFESLQLLRTTRARFP